MTLHYKTHEKQNVSDKMYKIIKMRYNNKNSPT